MDQVEHFMVPHTSVPEVHGIHQNPMESNGIYMVRIQLKFHISGFHRIPLDSMDSIGILQNPVESCGIQ